MTYIFATILSFTTRTTNVIALKIDDSALKTYDMVSAESFFQD